MKKYYRFLLPACLLLAGSLTGCSRADTPSIHLLQIEGVSWACNVTTSYAIFGSGSDNEDETEILVAASEGDLLYLMNEELQVYYRYHERDGLDLAFEFDTLGPVLVYLNGKLNSLEITENSPPEILEALSDPELAQLSVLYIQGPIPAVLLSRLEALDTRLQGMSLVLEQASGSESLGDLLNLCRPEFLVLDETWHLPEPEQQNLWNGLELLWVQGTPENLSELNACCGDLESLIMFNWEPRPGELLNLAPLKNLKNLTLAESDLTTLENIECPKSLISLNLIDCDTLTQIGQLNSFPVLFRLNLTDCDALEETVLLKNPQALRWTSLPVRISQEEFQKIVSTSTRLEMLELIGCEELTDLNPLKQQEHLRILALQLEQDQLTGLDSLTQLEALILSFEFFFDNDVWINELRASLPTTQVVSGSGICLGSGWLLLLLPMMLLFRLSFRKKTLSSAGR